MRETTRRTVEERRAVMAGIAGRIERGVSLVDAALAEGARPETVRTWLRRGRAERSGVYAAFAEAVEEARGRGNSRPEPVTEEELRRLVSDQARAGSVQALRLYWEMLRADRARERAVEPAPDGLGALDELARRRQAAR